MLYKIYACCFFLKKNTKNIKLSTFWHKYNNILSKNTFIIQIEYFVI